MTCRDSKKAHLNLGIFFTRMTYGASLRSPRIRTVFLLRRAIGATVSVSLLLPGFSLSAGVSQPFSPSPRACDQALALTPVSVRAPAGSSWWRWLDHKTERDRDFSEKVVLIAGASSGIGAELARNLARKGARVMLGARRLHRLDSLARQIRDAGGTASVVFLDITDALSRQNALHWTYRAFGPVDILILSAGIVMPGTPEEVTSEQRLAIDAVNVRGPLAMINESVRNMNWKNGSGRIVAIGSILSFESIRIAQHHLYGETKSALRWWMRYSAPIFECTWGIFLQHMALGYVPTELRRRGENRQFDPSAPEYIPPFLMTPVSEAAEQIVNAMRSSWREHVFSWYGKVLVFLSRLMPWAMGGIMKVISPPRKAVPAAADPAVPALVDGEVVVLQDGRRVGYKIYGDPKAPDDKTIVYLHGNGGSRLEPGYLNREGLEGFRIIAIDRPGLGYSSFKDHHEITTLAEDVRELANQLGIHHFRVISYSSGAPFALALAASEGLEGRIDSVDLISPLGPIPDEEMLAMYSPEFRSMYRLVHAYSRFKFLRPLVRWVARNWMAGIFDDQKWEKAFEKTLIPAESPMPAERMWGLAPAIRDNWRQVFAQVSPEGWLRDMDAYSRPWLMKLDRIEVPVRIWHGTEDQRVPYSAGLDLATRLPPQHTRFFRFEGEGHFLVVDRFAEVVAGRLPDSHEVDPGDILPTPTGAFVPRTVAASL